ncbi:hypothetical protein [Beggiatoa leptomitoformis]|uniref:SPOR domain-containing protein n=1 Tax=Beggiatoa leptomitoformis TaxID=288004 RepID=A0A2N9YFW8_9GAMM|nr:hypothetical protein [Beggiatoa leptomitoformis]ALG68297.1 hypothetical protein AL038_11970 [Beggiatoa leptomitoformis]AUI69392.1 hypothetical protein BLE401_12295 [Beggiatoa leptomitoformis]
MRVFALLLLLLNLAFFVWLQEYDWMTWLPWQPQQFKTDATPPENNSLPKLVLLSEYQAGTANIKGKTKPTIVATVTDAPPAMTTNMPPTPVTPPSEKPLQQATATPILDNAVKTNPQPTETKPDDKATSVVDASQPNLPAVPLPPTPQANNVATAETTPTTVVALSHTAPTLLAETVTPPDTAKTSPAVPVVAEKTTVEKNTAVAPVSPTPDTSKIAKPNKPVNTEQPPMPEKNPEKLPEKTPEKTIKPIVADTKKNIPVENASLNSQHCYQVGPDTDGNKLRMAASWFNQQEKNSARITRQADNKAVSTWVFLPPQKNRQMALDELKRLEQRGIIDFSLMTEGKYNNAISFGIFREENSAKQRLSELKNKGYTSAKLEKRYETDTRYWLNVRIPQGHSDLTKEFNLAFKGIKLNTIPCQ